MGCRCPKCGRPKDCYDELCIVCELKENIKDKAKNIVKKIGGKA